MPFVASARAPEGVLQRTCACGRHTAGGGECAECRRAHEGALQRASVQGTTTHEAPPIVHEALSSSGQPLDGVTRAFMEPRFGHDFSRVRVHSGGRAAESAQAVKAKAYTVGENVVFGAGEYLPQTAPGRRLLAHELTHVVQQSGTAPGGKLSIGEADNAHEREAESVSAALTLGEHTHKPARRSASAVLQRQPESEEAVPGLEGEEEGQEVEEDDTEVHDGDTPVNATPDQSQSEEQSEVGLGALALGDDVADTQDISGGEAIEMDAKGGKPGAGKKPAAPKKAAPKKITQIDIDLAAQKLTLIWSDNTKESHNISSGRGRPNTPDDPCKTQKELNCTPTGDFKVGFLGNADTKNSTGDAMSWYTGFVDSRGIGIHDSQPVPGVPASHGCVRVGNSKADDEFAKKINKNVIPGTTVVHVFGKAPTKPWVKPVKKKTAPPKKKK